jgi:hypothetical protein
LIPIKEGKIYVGSRILLCRSCSYLQRGALS